MIETDAVHRFRERRCDGLAAPKIDLALAGCGMVGLSGSLGFRDAAQPINLQLQGVCPSPLLLCDFCRAAVMVELPFAVCFVGGGTNRDTGYRGSRAEKIELQYGVAEGHRLAALVEAGRCLPG